MMILYPMPVLCVGATESFDSAVIGANDVKVEVVTITTATPAHTHLSTARCRDLQIEYQDFDRLETQYSTLFNVHMENFWQILQQPVAFVYSKYLRHSYSHWLPLCSSNQVLQFYPLLPGKHNHCGSVVGHSGRTGLSQTLCHLLV